MRPLLPLAMLLVCGCTIANCRNRLTAQSVGHPVSMTGCFFDSAGNLVKRDRYEVVGHFQYTRSNWSILFAVHARRVTKDISDVLRRELDAKSGDAIVNLTASSDIYGVPLLSAVIPLLPNYVRLTLEGDVAKVAGSPDR